MEECHYANTQSILMWRPSLFMVATMRGRISPNVSDTNFFVRALAVRKSRSDNKNAAKDSERMAGYKHMFAPTKRQFEMGTTSLVA